MEPSTASCHQVFVWAHNYSHCHPPIWGCWYTNTVSPFTMCFISFVSKPAFCLTHSSFRKRFWGRIDTMRCKEASRSFPHLFRSAKVTVSSFTGRIAAANCTSMEMGKSDLEHRVSGCPWIMMLLFYKPSSPERWDIDYLQNDILQQTNSKEKAFCKTNARNGHQNYFRTHHNSPLANHFQPWRCFQNYYHTITLYFSFPALQVLPLKSCFHFTDS